MAYFEGCEHFEHSPFLLQITAAGNKQVNQKSIPPHPAFCWDSQFFWAGEHKRTEACHLKSKLFFSLGFCELEAFVDCQLERKKVHLIL